MATYASDGTQSNILFIHDNNAVDGDTITLPTGTFPWTVTLTLTKAITLQGAGAISSTDGGVSLTGSDLTTVIDHHPTPEHKLLGFQVPSGKTSYLTGIRFLSDAGSVNTQAGMIQIGGGANCIRVHHNHFAYAPINPGGPSTIAVYNGVTGVIDHNYFDQDAPGNGPVGVYLQNGSATGDDRWSSPDAYGTNDFIFIEDNKWRNGYLGDANTGGQRWVYRYNTGVMEFNDNDHSSQGYVANHGLTGGRGRSTRLFEFYHNNFSAEAPIGLNKSPIPLSGGTGLIWGNTFTQYRYVTTIDYTRQNNMVYPYGTPPTGWGNCNGTTLQTVWDGPGGGYPALDQPGRGQGDLLSGNFPNIINTRTGAPAQVIQASSPVYIFNNTFNPAGGFSPTPVVGVQAPAALVQANRDYYQQFGTNGEPGSFDGTRGVGQGLLSAMPPTGTLNVGYWATDTQTLYTYNSGGSPVAKYTPYVYPHPLQGGSPPPPPPPQPQGVTGMLFYS